MLMDPKGIFFYYGPSFPRPINAAILLMTPIGFNLATRGLTPTWCITFTTFADIPYMLRELSSARVSRPWAITIMCFVFEFSFDGASRGWALMAAARLSTRPAP